MLPLSVDVCTVVPSSVFSLIRVLWLWSSVSAFFLTKDATNVSHLTEAGEERYRLVCVKVFAVFDPLLLVLIYLLRGAFNPWAN